MVDFGDAGLMCNVSFLRRTHADCKEDGSNVFTLELAKRDHKVCACCWCANQPPSHCNKSVLSS